MPHPASRRRSVVRQVATALLVGAVLMPMAASVPRAAAVESTDSLNRLDHPIVDLALLEPSGPDDAPRFLVVDAIETLPGVFRIAILRRDGAWEVDSEMQVDLGVAGVTPWLVGLSATRFALLAVTTGAGAEGTVIVGIQTDAGPGRADLAETTRQALAVAIDDAGAVDVDGDGIMELVVGTARTTRTGGTCQGSTLRILDGSTLAPRGTTLELPGQRLAAGVIGRWDSVPGDDLLAYAYPNCPARPDAAGEVRLIAIRLVDGAIVLDQEGGNGADTASFVGPPMRLDLDGIGMHEVVALGAQGLSVLDPTSGWAAQPIGSMRATPVVAGNRRYEELGAVRIAWFDPLRPVGIMTTRLVRAVGGGILDMDRDELRLGVFAASRRDAAFTETLSAVQRQVPPAGWLGATIDGGCPDLVMAAAILPCGATELRTGAAWIGTRPVTVLDDEGNRRLVVAAGLGWDASTGYPQTPSPWATAPAGWWRHGPSGPFALAELRAADLMYFREFPTPSATLERTSAADATIGIPGFTGVRMFVGISALLADAPEPQLDQRFGSLQAQADGSSGLSVSRIPVPPGVEAGRDGGLATISLGDTTLADGTRADRWWVGVVPFNDWGEMGPSVAGVVLRDAVGPSLIVEAPFTSAVWPFTASIAGSAEPRSVVRVAGVGDMELDRRGRFTIQTGLAPWPQTLRVTATDASGNITLREVSVIGGIDYRRFPWAMIAALALLALVAVRGLLGSRLRAGPPGLLGRRTVALSSADDGPLAEMEDLPPGGGLA